MEPSSSRFCLPGYGLRSCLRLGPSAGPSLTRGRCWKSLNWRRAARVLHAISHTPGFLPSWGLAGQVLSQLLLPPCGSASRPLPCSAPEEAWSARTPALVQLACARLGPIHHPICQYGSANPAPWGQWPCIAQQCKQQF